MNNISQLTILTIGLVVGGLAYTAWEHLSVRSFPALDVNPGTYEARAAGPVLIRKATLMDGLGGQFENTDILLEEGKIKQIGKALSVPSGANIIEGAGKFVTPGLIDVHSHLGVASLPYGTGDVGVWDVNEGTSAQTPEVHVEHAIWPQDPSFSASLSGGVTTLQVLPGSSNLFGGLGVVLKNIPSVTAQAMKFPGAPYGLKLACGENPKNYGMEGQAPGSRMGNMAMQRQAWVDARGYAEEYRDGDRQRDLGMEVLAGALRGDVKLHVHCYRADDMANILDMAREFNLQIAAFHHAVEAYKISDLLVRDNICSAVWSDWWGYKLEAFDGIKENAAFLEAAGACVVLHTDFPVLAHMMNVEAAKALAAGQEAGIEMSEAEALSWITINAAKVLGLDDRIGSLEVSKNADVVLWSGDPFSIYSKAELVFIDGVEVYDIKDGDSWRNSDFMIGQPAREDMSND
ncbi:amidohydrolase [Emcibacter sp.]|uniref:amidohydrolase n=1 Tax=Emcibacter sp. TaxID=1979954 RepID=UPI003A8EB45B